MKKLTMVLAALVAANLAFAADAPKKKTDFPKKTVVITVKHPEDEEHDEPWREVIVVGVPGNRTVDMKRLEAQFAPAELEEATEEDLKQHPELVPGYIGPMVLGPQAEAAGVKNPVRYLIDAHVVKGSAWFTGADENEVDYYNLVYGRDFKADGVVEAVEVRHQLDATQVQEGHHGHQAEDEDPGIDAGEHGGQVDLGQEDVDHRHEHVVEQGGPAHHETHIGVEHLLGIGVGRPR